MVANNPDSLPFSPISFWYSTRTSLHSTVRTPVNGIQIVYPSGSSAQWGTGGFVSSGRRSARFSVGDLAHRRGQVIAQA